MMIKTASLTDKVLHIVKEKGTEKEFSGEYDDFEESGTYLCRQCGLALFRSKMKFRSSCGWASFDEEIPGALTRRVEILCSRCGAHLGHAFEGEGYTEKNLRYCVNSLGLDFVTDLEVYDTEEAIFAGGCFWGIEYYMQQLPGVLKTEAGYTGGHLKNPTSNDVMFNSTGHCEAVRVVYNPTRISYETLAKYFFEIHHFSPWDANGPPRPQLYQSAIFYYTDEQKQIAEKLINELEKLAYAVETKVLPVSPFWRAAAFDQHYYQRRGTPAECHRYEKKFP